MPIRSARSRGLRSWLPCSRRWSSQHAGGQGLPIMTRATRAAQIGAAGPGAAHRNALPSDHFALAVEDHGPAKTLTLFGVIRGT